MPIHVTKHAIERFKQRLGFNKSAAQRMAKIAFIKGVTHKTAIGKDKRYIQKLFKDYQTANNIRIYGDVVYIFANENLLTVFIKDYYCI